MYSKSIGLFVKTSGDLYKIGNQNSKIKNN